DSVFHGVDRVAPGDAVDLPALKPGMQLAFDGDGRWSVRDGDSAVAGYRWDELRFSISWKAYCFADEAERDAWRTHTDDLSLDDLRSEAATCEACDLYKLGTQTVFGEGPEDADLMLMGEVPGDQEDRSGHPFVGPAGKLLDRALVEAEIDRGNVYVTNAVKHFKWK